MPNVKLGGLAFKFYHFHNSIFNLDPNLHLVDSVSFLLSVVSTSCSVFCTCLFVHVWVHRIRKADITGDAATLVQTFYLQQKCSDLFIIITANDINLLSL